MANQAVKRKRERVANRGPDETAET